MARRGLWEAEHLLDLGDLARARSLTENNPDFCRANGWPGHAAHCHAVLGSIAAREGDERAAREHLTAIDAWTDLSGEVEMVLRAGELRGALPGGERAAEEGAAKAERLGFSLFQVRLLRLANSAPTPIAGRRSSATPGDRDDDDLAARALPGAQACARYQSNGRGGATVASFTGSRTSYASALADLREALLRDTRRRAPVSPVPDPLGSR